MKLRVLMKDLGYKKRSAKSIEIITKAFQRRNLHLIPKLSLELNLDDNIHISDFPEYYAGDFFETENQLEKALIDKGTLESIGVQFIKNQKSPLSSPTRIDIYGEDINDGRKVVVELKKERINGYVSQIFEYVSLIKRTEGHSRIRRILITGIMDRSTAHAINGLSRLEQEYFEWYIYKYSKDSGELSLIEVDLYEIKRMLNKEWQKRYRTSKEAKVSPGYYIHTSGRKIKALGVAREVERNQEMIVFHEIDSSSNELKLMSKNEFCEEHLKNKVWNRIYQPIKI